LLSFESLIAFQWIDTFETEMDPFPDLLFFFVTGVNIIFITKVIVNQCEMFLEFAVRKLYI